MRADSEASPALDTFTASTDNSVAVGIGEPEATFVYYKTLERTSGNAYGSAAYNYTTIPNPFSIRPTYGTGDNAGAAFTPGVSRASAAAPSAARPWATSSMQRLLSVSFRPESTA